MAKRFGITGSFADRKAARIAAGQRKFVFVVDASSVNAPDVELARFNSRREAMAFAFQQVCAGPDYTEADREFSRRFPLQRRNPRFSVTRIDVASGERTHCQQEWVAPERKYPGSVEAFARVMDRVYS